MLFGCEKRNNPRPLAGRGCEKNKPRPLARPGCEENKPRQPAAGLRKNTQPRFWARSAQIRKYNSPFPLIPSKIQLNHRSEPYLEGSRIGPRNDPLWSPRKAPKLFVFLVFSTIWPLQKRSLFGSFLDTPFSEMDQIPARPSISLRNGAGQPAAKKTSHGPWPAPGCEKNKPRPLAGRGAKRKTRSLDSGQPRRPEAVACLLLDEKTSHGRGLLFGDAKKQATAIAGYLEACEIKNKPRANKNNKPREALGVGDCGGGVNVRPRAVCSFGPAA